MAKLSEQWRNRPLPRGAAWWKCTGGLLLWLVALETLTGVLLLTVYTPSVTDAWASTWYIQYELPFGNLIRGLHYYGAHVLLIVVAIHLVRVLLTGAYRRPFYGVWITGLLLVPVVLLLAASGNPLPWSHKAVGQVQVETHIIGSMPGLGPVLQRLVVGGAELGQRTLSHFFALHVAVLPLVGVWLLWIHVQKLLAASRQAAAELADAPSYFPHQTVWNAVAFAIVLGGLVYLSLQRPAPLGPPADPTLPSSPRPEWYFLALFELRRYFTGALEFVATGILPGVLLLWFAALPLVERIVGRRLGRLLAWFSVLAVGSAAALLTWLPLRRDADDAQHQAIVSELDAIGERAVVLARLGIPPEGPAELLQRDPVTMGPILFRKHCATCHPYGGQWCEEPKASDLKGFGTEEWLWALVQKPDDPRFFGHTKHREMAEWSKETLATASEEEIEEIRRAVQWLAMHPKGTPEEEDKQSAFAQGYEAFDAWCIECHTYEGDGGFNIKAPDFTGYGSVEWIAAQIRNAASEHLYGEEAEMPAFEEKLTEVQIQVLARWLAGESDPVLDD